MIDTHTIKSRTSKEAKNPRRNPAQKAGHRSHDQI